MGRVLVKVGVQFTVIAPAGFRILEATKAVAQRLQVDLWITSACDGEHSGPSDPHHTGEAYDIRSHDLLPELRLRVLAALRTELGDKFYVFLEDAGTSNEHFHAQRLKGTAYTIDSYLAA